MDASKPHILIVDDEMGPRESLKMILNPHYNVHVAERGGQAVEGGEPFNKVVHQLSNVLFFRLKPC